MPRFAAIAFLLVLPLAACAGGGAAKPAGPGPGPTASPATAEPTPGAPCGEGQRYLTPGCTSNPLPAAGCYNICEGDVACPDGTTCRDSGYDPCHGMACDACGASLRVCLR